jgi:hypothetical protein
MLLYQCIQVPAMFERPHWISPSKDGMLPIIHPKDVVVVIIDVVIIIAIIFKIV